MARVKSAEIGIPAEEEAASVPSAAANKPRKTLSNVDGDRDLSALWGKQLAHMHPFTGGCLLGKLRQESRGVAAESTKFRDCKRNEADVGAIPHPLRVLLELGLLSVA
jgi:hypothetical protein